MHTRASGILLHLTSLPSPFGVGDLGPEAYRFADFLFEARQTYWQILPFGPTDGFYGNSPYHTPSAFAGNPLFISPEAMVDAGWLHINDLDGAPQGGAKVDFEDASAYKNRLFDQAWDRFQSGPDDPWFERFKQENAFWLDDYALFAALKTKFEYNSWTEWPQELRDRHPEALDQANRELAHEVNRHKFIQYVFDRQWRDLRRYLKTKAVNIIGDMPIYVQHDSADVWANPDLFLLDGAKKPYVVAGVPPDYFSATGQLWGNPLYRWDLLAQTRYDWWIKRVQRTLELADFVRIDHFRGLVAFWEVPATESTAINGRWVKAPAWDFLKRLSRIFPGLPFIAEDLGVITPDVIQVIQEFNLPGMKVLLFAFGDDVARNPFAPHNHVRNCVVYTGTHDNNTVRGWWDQEMNPEMLDRVFRYLGRGLDEKNAPFEFIRLALGSVADTVILPIQDVLGLGAEARMNTPATTVGNWTWRLEPGQIGPDAAAFLKDLSQVYGRD